MDVSSISNARYAWPDAAAIFLAALVFAAASDTFTSVEQDFARTRQHEVARSSATATATAEIASTSTAQPAGSP